MMLPEIGLAALIIAFLISVLQCVLPIIGAFKLNQRLIETARPLATVQFLLVALSFIILLHAFVINDFSLEYVALHSNTHLPLFYRIGAVWGAHEGSLLLWILILNVWTVAVCLFSRSVDKLMIARVIGVLGFISAGFLLFIIVTSNPFLRTFPNIPMDGADLNPILQDPGLMFHPPMLYMGYVGFSVAFAFAVAALLSGRLDAAWIRWTRPWTNVAWAFLTLGIVLGSAWAYRQLGWGGWWFWDPVENASLMPWLVGTALIHSLAVSEKRDVLKSWTVLLAIFAFSMSLMGTFLVRSGVLTSVHAFAVDPQRGLAILIYLFVVIGGSLTLYAWRASTVRAVNMFEVYSRETFLLANNVLLIVAAATVLIGTLYPLLLDALHLDKISVGPPYFNLVFSVLMTPLLFLLGLAPLSRWKTTDIKIFLQNTWVVFIVCIVLSLLIPFVFPSSLSFGLVLGLFLSFWIILVTLQDLTVKSKVFRRLSSLSLSYYGMVIAHIGMAVTTLGIVLSSHYSVERDVRLLPDQTATLSGYTFQFLGVHAMVGSNYKGVAGDFLVFQNGDDTPFAAMESEKRVYIVQNFESTKADINSTITRDLYVSLGDQYDDGSWSLRLYVKPFIRWIWAGGFMMLFGGLLAMFDHRYRVKK